MAKSSILEKNQEISINKSQNNVELFEAYNFSSLSHLNVTDIRNESCLLLFASQYDIYTLTKL